MFVLVVVGDVDLRTVKIVGKVQRQKSTRRLGWGCVQWVCGTFSVETRVFTLWVI